MGCLNELLVAPVQQARHFAVHQRSRMHGQGCLRVPNRILGLDGNQHGRGPMLAHQHAACDSGEGSNIKRMGAQDLQRLIEVRIAGFSGHGRFPVCEDIEAGIGRIFLKLQPHIPNLA